MGERRTVELSLTGREFTAAEALDYGLVTEIADDPLQRATGPGVNSWRASARSPSGPGSTMCTRFEAAIGSTAGKSWPQDSRAACFRARISRKVSRAFLEKRHPSWPSLDSKLGK